MKKIEIEEKITTALLDLMKENDYESISITDITLKAGLSRVTYYRHFSSKEDIIIKFFEHAKEKFLSQVKQNNTNLSNDLMILSLFIYFKANMEVNKTLRKAKLDNELLKFLSNEFLENLPIKLEKYYAYFIAGALFNVCINWLDNDCKDPIEDVTRPFIKINNLVQESKNK